MQTLIIGIDTVAGRALAQQLKQRSHVTGLWINDPEPIDGCSQVAIEKAALTEHVTEADVVIFCGGASSSSWDDDFGELETEKLWLPQCVKAVSKTGRKLVFISSDAVFQGPWVFHDDDSCALASNRIARKIQGYEALAATLPDSLIVRTNIIGHAPGSFVTKFLNAFDKPQSIRLDSATYATPISATAFAETLERCLTANICQQINIAGAERTSPFQLATMIANSLNLSARDLQPKNSRGAVVERSLRCQRLRTELSLFVPVLRETVESLADQECDSLSAAAA